jgi:hypothetical protein
MSAGYTKAKAGLEFTSAREQFETTLSWLQSGEAAGITHAELEEKLEAQGRELLRRLCQDHLDLRALREERQSEVVGSEGCVRTHVREADRPLMTLFGLVRVRRLSYGQRGVTSLSPADVTLNLPEEEYSHGLRRHAAEQASKVSYQETVLSIEEHTGGKVAPRQTQELVRRAARDFDAFYAERMPPGPEATEDLLILSLDGKGIVMRPEHLREATRKAAEESTRKLGRRLSRGEKRDRKRMATVAAIYSIERWERGALDIMGGPRPSSETAERPPRAWNKRVWASVEKDASAVTRQLFDEAERRDPEHRRKWVVLVDGDRSQIKRVRKEARRRRVTITLVLDLIHVLEYLWKAAWCFFKEGDRAAEEWVQQRAIRILEGHSSDVAAGIRRSATRRALDTATRVGADKCADYLIAKRKCLHYDEYLRDGLPIATGVIEGACRHLINDRLDITGARWGVPGAEAVLRLRSLRSSGDFDEYWRFHLAREQQRIHLSRYASHSLPKAA